MDAETVLGMARNNARAWYRGLSRRGRGGNRRSKR